MFGKSIPLLNGSKFDNNFISAKNSLIAHAHIIFERKYNIANLIDLLFNDFHFFS